MKAGDELFNFSFPESEEELLNILERAAGSSGCNEVLPSELDFKMTSSSSSLFFDKSAQFLEGVTSSSPVVKSIFEKENYESTKDFHNGKTSGNEFVKHSEENEKKSDKEWSRYIQISLDDVIEISSDDESVTRQNPTTNPVSVKEEKSLDNMVINLKTEEFTNQNVAVKNEYFGIVPKNEMTYEVNKKEIFEMVKDEKYLVELKCEDYKTKIEINPLKEEYVKEKTTDGDIKVLKVDCSTDILQQLTEQSAHQVKNLPTVDSEQLQFSVPPLSENLLPSLGVTNLKKPSRPVCKQRTTIPPMVTSNTSQNLTASRGRGFAPVGSRGKVCTPSNTGTGKGTRKRPASNPSMKPTPPIKHLSSERNSYSNNKDTTTTQLIKSKPEFLNKPASKTASDPIRNIISNKELSVFMVDLENNTSIPAELGLYSELTIIPSPKKNCVNSTGREFYPCQNCPKVYATVEAMYGHVFAAHKTVSLPFKCNICTVRFPNAEVLHSHKISVHKSEMNSSSPVGIPIFDFSEAGTAAKFKSMGVVCYLPVAKLDHQGDNFGVPIMNSTQPSSLNGLKLTDYFRLNSFQKL